MECAYCSDLSVSLHPLQFLAKLAQMMEDCTRKDVVFFISCSQTSALPRFFRFWGGFMNQGHEQIATTVVGETAKSAPPVAVVSMSWAGVSLNDWVLIATLVWLSVQIGWFIWSNIIKPRAKQAG